MLIGPVGVRKTKGTVSFIIAASNSAAQGKRIADYVCDGTADDVQIQAAINALPAGGGKVSLLEGAYTLASIVSRAIDNVAVEGCGESTYLANDASTFIFDVGRQAGWSFHNLATDAGGINLGFDEQADVSNCWRAGEKINNRVVGAIEHIATLASPGYQGTHDVAVQGDYAYAVCYNTDAFHVIDISDPENPSIVATLTDAVLTRLDGAHDVIVDGDYAYVTVLNKDSIVSIDISTPASPVIADELVDNVKLNAVHALAKQGDYIYAGGLGGNYFCVVDASDPTDMSVVGSVSDATYLHFPRGVYPKGDYVYVVTKGGGYLTVVDVSTKATPVIDGTPLQIVASPTQNDCANLRVRGDYAYCTTQAHDELVVVDISNHSSMSVVARLTIVDAYYITLAGNYAFVSDYDIDMYVVDITNPAAPRILYDFYSTDAVFASGMALYKDYILISPRDKVDVALAVGKLFPKELQPKTKRIIATRDLAAAAGLVAYTGVGFCPTSIQLICGSTNNNIFSTGFADENRAACCAYDEYGTRYGWYDTTYICVLGPTDGNYQRATVASYDADGFTLNWGKVGAPTGSVTLMALCRR